ncbi:hypothetical protein ABEB36_007157 [Hypothenemus hampei]|uniref:PH domain-containing protein n=2 Tax=Hypothenemus hampei TaxID=57062 RepID=A0ABD1ET20_HYPHA
MSEGTIRRYPDVPESVILTGRTSPEGHDSSTNGPIYDTPNELQTDVVHIQKTAAVSSSVEHVYVSDKDSVQSLSDADTKRSPRIFMGKKSMMIRTKSNEMEEPLNEDAAVVYDLVTEKFQDQLTNCYNRIYHRGFSRESYSSINTDYNDCGSTSIVSTPENGLGNTPKTPKFTTSSAHFPDDLQIINGEPIPMDVSAANISSICSHDETTKCEMEAFDPHKYLQNMDSTSLHSNQMDASIYHSLRPCQSLNCYEDSFLGKVNVLYSSLRKNVKKNRKVKEQIEVDATPKKLTPGRQRCQSLSPSYSTFQDIRQELFVQNGIIFQASKALALCHSENDHSSPEYVEAEKILLVASCRKEALQVVFDNGEPPDTRVQTCLGSLDIFDLIFNIKASSFDEGAPPKNYEEYFVIVLTCGKKVLASKVLIPNINGEVKEEDKTFQFKGLPTDFEISVAIYSIKIKSEERSNHNHKERRSSCPSAKGLFHSSHKVSRRDLFVDHVTSIKPSAFSFCGSSTIRCSNLKKTHFRMQHVPLSSSLEPWFTASLRTNVKFLKRTTGLLSIALDGMKRLIWDQRWCVLDGTVLRYWNYPTEEHTSDPIGTIDISALIERAESPDRSLCPRPKCLCLLVKNRDNSISRYFLAANSLNDKLRWQNDINFIFDTLEAWNYSQPEQLISSL